MTIYVELNRKDDKWARNISTIGLWGKDIKLWMKLAWQQPTHDSNQPMVATNPWHRWSFCPARDNRLMSLTPGSSGDRVRRPGSRTLVRRLARLVAGRRWAIPGVGGGGLSSGRETGYRTTVKTPTVISQYSKERDRDGGRNRREGG